ncbi:acetate/propionate family kinase [Calorimonas adulescens]|uniref:Acetate kinase n=1 Tax=Calorimonas adulescens TaxID=2606906 RepID=A0A5D8QIR7_9THEO|nr:acetate kinase [Calorimonas adulescens]TZE83393.1 acetate kinase [Calorimonas adulescens]
MNILVINCGSSSLKYQLIDMSKNEVLVKGIVERIGIDGSQIKYEKTGAEKKVFSKTINNHKEALKEMLDLILDEQYGAIKSLKEIDAVGHRIVHGGEKFSGSVIIDDEVIKALNDSIDLAPLHNPPNIMGIMACRELMPDVPMVGVFDTAFHQTMPPEAFIYGIPYEFYEKYKIRRYGFHGTSHKYVTSRAAELLGKKVDDVNLITCHLGNGSSVTAVKKGKSIDTSMGFTPLEGLIMGTRCGSIDPSIVSYLMDKESLNISEVMNILNKKSGVLGLSGISSDFRDIEDAAANGNIRASIALKAFTYGVKKYIGSYYAVLGTVDAIVFTAGVGENSDIVREMILDGLETLGIILDKEANRAGKKEREISTRDSKTRVFVIPTNEELMIASETAALVSK